MLNYHNSDYAKYLISKGILHITYTEGIIIDLDTSVQIVEDRLILQQGQLFPILCDIRGVKEINKSARDYLAIEGSILIKAVAFIVESPVSEILSKFYLKTSNPPIPSKTFTEVPEALVFLSKFL